MVQESETGLRKIEGRIT